MTDCKCNTAGGDLAYRVVSTAVHLYVFTFTCNFTFDLRTVAQFVHVIQLLRISLIFGAIFPWLMHRQIAFLFPNITDEEFPVTVIWTLLLNIFLGISANALVLLVVDYLSRCAMKKCDAESSKCGDQCTSDDPCCPCPRCCPCDSDCSRPRTPCCPKPKCTCQSPCSRGCKSPCYCKTSCDCAGPSIRRRCPNGCVKGCVKKPKCKKPSPRRKNCKQR